MRKLSFLFPFICFWVNCTANNIIVTSNADSGPGTLRDAITIANANGSAVFDTISFNIPQAVFNLRMIELVTELPSLSSNIILDGTTQPGTTYGTTDAKICIKKNDYAPTFTMLTIENAINVQVYGLCLYYGYWQGFFSPPSRSSTLFGINIISSKNIIVGAPGKGNVINGVGRGIFSNSDNCSDVFVQSNYLGQGRFYENPADDIDPVVLPAEYCVVLMNIKNVTIGGDQPEYGNIFGSRIEGIYVDSKNATGNGLLKIRYNKFGRGYDKTTRIIVFDFWDAYVSIGQSGNGPLEDNNNITDYRVELLDNDIPNHAFIGYQSDSVIVLRNHFEEDNRDDSHQTKLGIAFCSGGVTVGNNDGANANFFKNKSSNKDYPSIVVYDCPAVTMLKNVFDCNSTTGSTTYVYQYLNKIPWAQVDLTTSTFVEGRATPGTRVDLYYDDICTACEGKVYIGKALADATTGKWKYLGAFNGTVVATATTSGGATSQFSMPLILTDKMVVQHPTCGKKNGNVTGIATEGAETYRWIDYNTKDTVSYSIDLKNVGPGAYYLYAIHGGTCIYPYFVSLEDKTPYIYPSQVNIKQPSCGLFNGFINGLTVYNGMYAIKKWVDETGNIIGTENYLNQLGQGTYRYIVTDTLAGGGCSDTATFVLVNQSGPSLDLTGLFIKPATCGNKIGSITGIMAINVNGTPFIEWRDSTGKNAGNSLDIINLAEGKYRLYFKDDTGCDTIITPFFKVKDTAAISINEASVITNPTGCLTKTGSISGILATSTSTYLWKNVVTNSVVGNTLNLAALGAGTYQLTASNTAGCSAVSSVISIATSSFDAIQVKTFDKKDASCNNADGSITVTSFDKDASAYTFRWTDSALNQPVPATNNAISDLVKGNYQLFATDKYGCEKKIFSAFVDSFPTPDLDFTAMQIASDVCKTGKGGITDIKVINIRGAATYQWLDANNKIVGTSLNLNNVVAGSYYLEMKDSYNCGASSSAIIIPDDVNAATAPAYKDIIVMKNTTAVLATDNYEAADYFLFADNAGTQLLQQNKTGIFNIERVAEDKSVFVQRITGTCKSRLVRVNIKVVESSYFLIPKAFSPNDDLLNDRLSVKVAGSLQLSYFKIYNRYGQLVFETRNLNTAWDGKFKFMKQPGGTYIWLAEGKDMLGNTVNAKGAVVLIR